MSLRDRSQRDKTLSLFMLMRMRKVTPFLLVAIAAFLSTTALKAQALKFADENFSLSAKDADAQKIENDYILAGETETNWSQRLVITRFPGATDVAAFANNLCIMINNQRPGTGAAVAKLGADSYIVYTVTSSMGGQLNMFHRILVDPQGGVRTYVYAQRPAAAKSTSNQAAINHDDSIHALARLSPIIQLAQ